MLGACTYSSALETYFVAVIDGNTGAYQFDCDSDCSNCVFSGNAANGQCLDFDVNGDLFSVQAKWPKTSSIPFWVWILVAIGIVFVISLIAVVCFLKRKNYQPIQ
jgi:hypothetical protein